MQEVCLKRGFGGVQKVEVSKSTMPERQYEYYLITVELHDREKEERREMDGGTGI
jgi:hypothetical protein